MVKGSGFGWYALSSCVAAAMVTGCGAAGAMPRNPASARVDTAAQRIPLSLHFQVLHHFHYRGGINPDGRLRNVLGTLYGTTHHGGSSGDGTVYSLSSAGKYKVLHQFGGSPDGAKPLGGLIDVNGTLYGTTSEGGTGCQGSNGCGTVYSIDATGSERVLYRFTGGPDGMSPSQDLLDVDGTLYGTTLLGGSGCSQGACGTVYRVSTTGKEKVLYSFTGGLDGAEPMGLTYANGRLYGTTYAGGYGCPSRGGCGTVYSLSTTGSERVLHRFAGVHDGLDPNAGLVAINGTLYGTTAHGGNYCCGIVFAISANGNENIVYNFPGNAYNGLVPIAGLLNVRGTLYGVTSQGGLFGQGAVYTITTKGAEKVIYSFNDINISGYKPTTALIDVNGTLYGTMYRGGDPQCANFGCGTVYALSP